MAKDIKRYDLKAADRRRNRLIQFGLTAIVVLFAVGMVLWIVKPWDHPPKIGAISVSEPDKLIKNSDGKPKAVMTIYEDFLCPVCGEFEKTMGPTVRQLISTGAIQADYYMVALLDRPQTDNYSSRAGNAGYCVAQADTSPNKAAFQRFHDALYKQQPSETGTTFPTNAQLMETARLAGISSQSLSDCINNGKYLKEVRGLVQNTGITGTPTIKINGAEFNWQPRKTTPQQLVDAVTKITGPVPGLTPAPAPSPAPPAPAAP